MQIELNGHLYHDIQTVEEAVRAVTTASKGIAVAVNGEVVPKHRWGTSLSPDDKVEVLTATQGG
ncbi:sulfur carrier protein ThiS [Haloglycomyces albus]|uniref:sulfur carrier protein ThiS n=1 Tax=Haloglycomyces albus TaxID=526067 RepID=UPI00046CAE34|nr:sulfur carrier protein ThiS [Haloglycomyces albus]